MLREGADRHFTGKGEFNLASCRHIHSRPGAVTEPWSRGFSGVGRFGLSVMFLGVIKYHIVILFYSKSLCNP